MLKNKTIGWIGTGVMGHGMVQHLIKDDYKVLVYNRTKSKTDDLVKLGAEYVDSIADISQKSDIIFTIIGDPQSVRETYFGSKGILEHTRSGSVLVDMTTTQPGLSLEIYEIAKQKNIQTLDAPVSGGDVGAINGVLSIMVGGEQETYQTILPAFELMGKSIVYCGSAGFGQHTKMANQISIAGNTIGLCEALVYAEKNNLDLEKTIQVVSGGAGGSWGWNNLASRIIKDDLDTCFFIKHFVKDMRIVLDECNKNNITLLGLALVHQLYTSLVSAGDGNLGTQALIKAIRKLNNI
ncbi:NAD(P)-dependent oxidoreductase [Candidatus Gracilibacteria bacterium]|nr:NAD(P)-dependent oxidoreductase [Candidatus Gracilibacteria bacterium]